MFGLSRDDGKEKGNYRDFRDYVEIIFATAVAYYR